MKSARSLAMAMGGNCVKVTGVLFDIVRARCAEIGLAVGDTIRVVGRTDAHVVVRTTRGKKARLEREIAQFIVVTEFRARSPRVRSSESRSPRHALTPA